MEMVRIEYSDLKLLSNITQVSGFLCLAFAAIAYFYEERQYWGGLLGHLVTHPYRVFAFPLVVLGIILVVVGALIHDHAKKVKET